jgi:hypothetical protein
MDPRQHWHGPLIRDEGRGPRGGQMHQPEGLRIMLVGAARPVAEKVVPELWLHVIAQET